MKSSAKRFRWFMITLFIVLMAVCVGLSSVFMACSNDKDKDEDTGEEQGQENPGGTGEGTGEGEGKGEGEGEGNDDTVTPYLTLSDSTLSLTIGGEEGTDTATISVTSMTLADKTVVEDLSEYTVTWSSSNNNIATVDGGVVTAKGEGSCTITATIDTAVGECEVTVKDETPIIEETGLTRVEKVEATCTEDGHITYYTDEDGTIYFDGLGLREMTEEDIVIPAGHVLSRIKAVAATCGTDGNVEYWHCSVCEKDFSDAAGTTEINSVTDSATTQHIYSTEVYNSDSTYHWFACEICGDVNQQSVEQHTFGEWANDEALSDCTITVQTRSCSVCGYTETQETTGSGSHTFEGATDYVVMTAPTEESTGTAAPKCVTCDTVSDDTTNYITLPVLGDANYQTSTDAGDGSITYTYTTSVGGTSVTISFKAEWVETYADMPTALEQAGGESVKTTAPLTLGKFTYATGVYFEASNSNLPTDGTNPTYGVVNNQQKAIYFEVSGTQNYLAFDMRGANSGTMALYKVASGTSSYGGSDGTLLYTWAEVGSTKVSANTYTDYGQYLDAGLYYIISTGSIRIVNLRVGEYIVGQASVVGITATAASDQFLVGTTITTSDLGLNVTLVYDNNKTESVITGISTDLDSLTLHLGANTITVTYEDGSGQQWTCGVEIYMYGVYDIYVSDVAMEYTGGTYYTHNAQRVYLVGDAVNTDYITVTALAACGVTGMETLEFILDAADYVLDTTAVNTTTAGTYTVTATANMSKVEGEPIKDTYTVEVLAIDSSVQRAVINVDQTAEVGEDSESGIITVNRINDAVKLLELLGATGAERKCICVGEGEYWEKVEIDMPNVSLIGSNTTAGGVRGTQTVIVYDAMNGVMDPSGTTTFSTVGSATFTVASSATGFYAANITFRNYWNTNELYNESLTITSSTQADAAYINADKVIFNNVTFTGYHDTLEAENGRQLYYQCYIEGRTDFIFGNTATAYFYQCTIHSIGADSNNGGYVVATKGGTESAHVAYGYIFNGCNFEGDANVRTGSVSIARGWDKYMTIMVMNSTLDDSFSTEGFGNSTSSLNDRYTSMNADPVATQLFEYNNTGDGAIKVDGSHYVNKDGVVYEVVNGTEHPLFTLLSAEDAAKYEDFGVVFGKTNGTYTSYTDDWDLAFDIITITVESSSGTVTTICATNSISVLDLVDAINVRITNGEVEGIFSDAGLTTELTGTLYADTIVYISVMEKDMSVKESTYWDFTSATYDDSVAESGYLDDEKKLYLDCGDSGSLAKYDNGSGSVYYTLNNGASIQVVLKAGSILGVGVYANDGSLSVTDESGNAVTGTYSTTGSNVAFTYTAEEDGTYVISQSSSAQSTMYLTYINVAIPVTEDTTISFRDKVAGPTYQSSSGWYKDVFVDATTSGAKFSKRSNGDVQIATGTVIYIQSVPGANVSINWYPDYKAEFESETSENGLVKITIGTGENSSGIYLYDIVIVVPTVYEIGEYIDFKNLGSENDLEGASGAYKGVIIDAESGKFAEHNGGECVMINANTVITIYSVEGATAELDYYPGYSDAATIVTDENDVIKITFTSQTYIYGITIKAQGSDSGDAV